MTNSEAIKLLSQEKIPMTLDGKLNEPLVIAHIKAISVLEENTKLKADVEQFSNELISVRIENELLKKKNELTNYYFEQYAAAIDEIERLKEEVLANKKWSDVVERTLKKEIDKNEMLKSELEQSVKLPCKVGDNLYRPVPKLYKDIAKMKVKGFKINECGFRFETTKGTEWNCSSIGKTIFLTREEAEKHLKGQV